MRRIRVLSVSFACLGFGLSPGHAHPHEFIDTGITFRFDDRGQLGAIGVVWAWDELTSMLIVEDMEMDTDGDGELNGDELQRLRDHFGRWPDDFGGDLYVKQGGKAVTLSGPLDVQAEYRGNRVIIRHLRALPQRLNPETAPVIVQAYDPAYYAFYDLVETPGIRGREGCSVTIREADIAAAQKRYDQLLGQLTEQEIMEEGKYPEVGGAFADEVRLECDKRE
ncbi:DUF1007 family protein [Sinirhodobacter populi]|uniref:DUF1007 family protein n=1 Tax=Paenirhodobacter populi TaxID=2306993 RepID=A0A443K3L9_9RHOB|nr:DUF1007 family protein [Sinirhodobacter populi]RWR27350.1 DUF1007 family protein [Sinirhodobacter populi]